MKSDPTHEAEAFITQLWKDIFTRVRGMLYPHHREHEPGGGDQLQLDLGELHDVHLSPPTELGEEQDGNLLYYSYEQDKWTNANLNDIPNGGASTLRLSDAYSASWFIDGVTNIIVPAGRLKSHFDGYGTQVSYDAEIRGLDLRGRDTLLGAGGTVTITDASIINFVDAKITDGGLIGGWDGQQARIIDVETGMGTALGSLLGTLLGTLLLRVTDDHQEVDRSGTVAMTTGYYDRAPVLRINFADAITRADYISVGSVNGYEVTVDSRLKVDDARLVGTVTEMSAPIFPVWNIHFASGSVVDRGGGAVSVYGGASLRVNDYMPGTAIGGTVEVVNVSELRFPPYTLVNDSAGGSQIARFVGGGGMSHQACLVVVMPADVIPPGPMNLGLVPRIIQAMNIESNGACAGEATGGGFAFGAAGGVMTRTDMNLEWGVGDRLAATLDSQGTVGAWLVIDWLVQ